MSEITDTREKALAINLSRNFYGTFAEIGAGQEVARWFFRVGGAAGTIAKTISAYDMTVSDAIYGPCERYVSRRRLATMLDHEFGLLLQRLDAKRGESTRFFAFADTVTARSYLQKNESHGWLGIRFQHEPRAQPSDIIIHVRMLDPENVQQQEALGAAGVNLVYGAFALHREPERLVKSLLHSVNREHVEVDMVKFTGPAFEGVDNRLVSLQLVQHGLTDSAMFLANGEVAQAAEVLYKKCILVERGSFRPVTKVTLEMLEAARAAFVQEPKVQGQDVVVLMEMTLKNLLEGDRIDHRDFLDRADLLMALGQNVLISNYAEYHRLAAYLFRHTKQMIGLVMGMPSLREVFNEKYYSDLEGGILESLGRLFKNDLKLFVYPLLEPKTGALITAGNLRVEPHLRHLYAYLLENRFIDGLRDIDHGHLSILSRDVLGKIRAGDPAWEQAVPAEVAAIIKLRGLFNYRQTPVATASNGFDKPA